VNSLSQDVDAIASDAPVPFHWSEEDIALVYGNYEEGDEAKAAQAMVVDGPALFQMEVNKFYIYKPNESEGPLSAEGMRRHSVPFRLALCLRHGSMLDELIGDNVQYPGAYMLEYIPKSSDWAACKWIATVKKRNMQQNLFQWDNAVTPWPLTLILSGRLSARSAVDIGYYLERWARPELGEDWADVGDADNRDDRGNMLVLEKRKPRRKGKTGNKKRRK
jgi:hypothetical protein